MVYDDHKTMDVHAHESVNMSALHCLFYAYVWVDIYSVFDPNDASPLVNASARLDVRDTMNNIGTIAFSSVTQRQGNDAYVEDGRIKSIESP